MNNYNPSCGASGMQPGNCATASCYTRPDKNDTSCACAKTRFPANTAYAMAYVPFQQSGEVYACDKALSRGTIFPCLDLPFLKGCCK